MEFEYSSRWEKVYFGCIGDDLDLLGNICAIFEDVTDNDTTTFRQSGDGGVQPDHFSYELGEAVRRRNLFFVTFDDSEYLNGLFTDDLVSFN